MTTVQETLQHHTVYAEEGIYAGWPANHGAWQWGDEFLVGFIRGQFYAGGMHNVRGHLEKVLARSLDGGETWTVEVPNVNFEAKSVREAPKFSLDKCIIRVCGNYDHGGEYCIRNGGFYLSRDRGKTWRGAFRFNGVRWPWKNQRGTARTRVLDNMVFLSCATRRHWGSDSILCFEHDEMQFNFKSVVCADEYRAVMPAVARLGDRIVLAARRRGGLREGCWIDAFISDDNGQTWSPTDLIARTGGSNGNPPALIEANGNVYCAYADRTNQWIAVSISQDGVLWHDYTILRTGTNEDIGYPQLFKRTDGKLVCVYYWADTPEDHQHIEVTIFEP